VAGCHGISRRIFRKREWQGLLEVGMKLTGGAYLSAGVREREERG
jgi:hypothetical protein